VAEEVATWRDRPWGNLPTLRVRILPQTSLGTATVIRRRATGDEFCDCRDLGTIYSLISEEALCARHYWKRLAELPTVALEVGLKKPAAKVGLNQQRREFGESL
jgi:hypothetical protein